MWDAPGKLRRPWMLVCFASSPPGRGTVVAPGPRSCDPPSRQAASSVCACACARVFGRRRARGASEEVLHCT